LANGVNQQPAIVGNVIRAKPHNGAPPVLWRRSSRSSRPDSSQRGKTGGRGCGLRWPALLSTDLLSSALAPGWLGPAGDTDRPQAATEHAGASDGQALQHRLTSIDVATPGCTRTTAGARFLRNCAATIRALLRSLGVRAYWSVTRYDDIFTVELDHENYSSSSELGGIQVTDAERAGYVNFLRMDPPGHTRIAVPWGPIVAPSNIATRSADSANGRPMCLDALPRHETFDRVARVSTVSPT